MTLNLDAEDVVLELGNPVEWESTPKNVEKIMKAVHNKKDVVVMFRRRCGKSTLCGMIQKELDKVGIEDYTIIDEPSVQKIFIKEHRPVIAIGSPPENEEGKKYWEF